tara:strand:+ start:156 stop:1196 length:1041 start_codon:yes stop_codon:yes gene_type:complete
MKKYYSEILKNLNEDTEPLKLNDRVLLVDGLNTFIRAFVMNPSTNEDGIHIGGIKGFMLSMGYAIKNIKPTRVIVCFDGAGGSQRRRKLHPEYKQNRKVNRRLLRAAHQDHSDEDNKLAMKHQLQRLLEYLSNCPVTLVSIDKIEADDSIAYITKQILKNSKCFIMSSDKDFLQLVDKRVTVWSPTKKQYYFDENVKEEFDLIPENYIYYKCLLGDKGDNVPGLSGLGHKTLYKNLPILFGPDPITMDDIIDYAKTNALQTKALKLIADNVDHLNLNYQLMQLHETDISGSAKERLQNLVKAKIPSFVKYDFMKMLLEDRMWIVKNIEFWIRDVFLSLDTRGRDDK